MKPWVYKLISARLVEFAVLLIPCAAVGAFYDGAGFRDGADILFSGIWGVLVGIYYPIKSFDSFRRTR